MQNNNQATHYTVTVTCKRLSLLSLTDRLTLSLNDCLRSGLLSVTSARLQLDADDDLHQQAPAGEWRAMLFPPKR